MFQTLHLWSQILEISSLFYKIAQFLLCYKIQKALSLIFFLICQQLVESFTLYAVTRSVMTESKVCCAVWVATIRCCLECQCMFTLNS